MVVDLPKDGLRKGDTGAVVHIHPGSEAYIVEFFDADNSTKAIADVTRDQIVKLDAAG